MFHNNVSVEAQRRRILESLLLQASDIVWQLGLSGHPRDYMRLLESAGLVEHGKEIFVKFLNTKKGSRRKGLHLPAEIPNATEHCSEERRGKAVPELETNGILSSWG